MIGITSGRIRLLTDPGTFEPFQPMEGSGFILGSATMGDRPVHIYATDMDAPMRLKPFEAFTRVSAFLGWVKQNPAPLVLLQDTPEQLRATGGTFVPADGLALLAHDQGMGRIYSSLAALDGIAPRVAVLFAPMGASRSFPAALVDAMVMLDDAAVCLGRPDAVKLMTGRATDFQRLGGARIHATQTGMAHKVVSTERGALAWVREWLGHLPGRAGELPPERKSQQPRGDVEAAAAALGRDLNAPFDIHELIDAIADAGSWIEMGREFAGECATGFCSFEGMPAGVVANNAQVRGGILHPETCRKMARFVRLCGAFGLPLVFLADTPGFMVGEEVERQGIVQAAADLYTAIEHCPAPRVCVAVRKVYSAGLYAMAGPGFDSAFWAMPGASISIFGPEALRRFRQGQEASGLGLEPIDEMLAGALDPQVLKDKGLVQEIPAWRDLRSRLVAFVRQARTAFKQQENGE